MSYITAIQHSIDCHCCDCGCHNCFEALGCKCECSDCKRYRASGDFTVEKVAARNAKQAAEMKAQREAEKKRISKLPYQWLCVMDFVSHAFKGGHNSSTAACGKGLYITSALFCGASQPHCTACADAIGKERVS